MGYFLGSIQKITTTSQMFRRILKRTLTFDCQEYIFDEAFKPCLLQRGKPICIGFPLCNSQPDFYHRLVVKNEVPFVP